MKRPRFAVSTLVRDSRLLIWKRKKETKTQLEKGGGGRGDQ